MGREAQFYIGGQWVDPISSRLGAVVNPATGDVIAQVALGSAEDILLAVGAARRAFDSFSATSPRARQELLSRILSAYRARAPELADIISTEVGAPTSLALSAQVLGGVPHFEKMIEILEDFPFSECRGRTRIVREAIGVCGLITPWNWPLNQTLCKVIPALAAGCTMVLKPSELAPLATIRFAEILHDAGVPAGVFNLVNGDGATAGEALCSDPEVDMISFTGSTATGVKVARAAAPTVKRVHQELGGKSANILLPSADFEAAVSKGAQACFRNSGQSCNAPTRMLVPADKIDLVIEIAARTAEACRVGPPDEEGVFLGPLSNSQQFARVRDYIEAGIAEGAPLIAGGPGRPAGLDRGYYARPTVFAPVAPNMRVAREEIFGPVLSILCYEDEEHAVRLANDSPFGLAAYVQGLDAESADRVASRLRAGTIYVNHPLWDPGAPFGGYKQSGNGREYGVFGLEAFLEVKGIVGSPACLAAR